MPSVLRRYDPVRPCRYVQAVACARACFLHGEAFGRRRP